MLFTGQMKVFTNNEDQRFLQKGNLALLIFLWNLFIYLYLISEIWYFSNHISDFFYIGKQDSMFQLELQSLTNLSQQEKI